MKAVIDKAKHDRVDLTYVYGVALMSLFLFMAISLPIDTSRFGLMFPVVKKEQADIYRPAAFEGLDIHAKAYVVYDIVDKRIIAAKNENEPFPLASLTKVMTALTALNHYGKETAIVIREGSIEDGYDLGLKKGQTWTLGELLKYVLVFSSNDGAYAIADGLGGRNRFVDLMNADSALLGMSLVFNDPSGMDRGAVLGGKGTALDVAKMLAIARRDHPEILEATTYARVTVRAGTERMAGIPNTNQEIGRFFGAEASKTGFTDSAGGNLGVIVDVALGRPTAIIVLGSSREGRFSDVEQLYAALIESLK